MKPKPEVRVLAKQLCCASQRHRWGHCWTKAQWRNIPESYIAQWDAVAREAIKRIKGGEK